MYHLSRRQSQRLLQELFGIHISLGALSAIERRASEALESAYDEAKYELEHAAVKHSDATTWLRAGVLTSLWTLACASATVYAVFADGCRETIRPFFGARKGVLVSDRASVFTFWAMASRQICWAHLIRKFIAFSERDGPTGTFGRELLDCAAAGVRILARLSRRRSDARRACHLASSRPAAFRAYARSGGEVRYRTPFGLMR